MNCVVKSFVLKRLNKLLDEHKDNVDDIRYFVKVWLFRTTNIVKCLENILSKLDDNKVDDDELKDVIEKLKAFVKDW